MLCLITYKVRSENGYGFLRPGLKKGVRNGIFWSEIGSGFGDTGGTPPPKIPRSTPPWVQISLAYIMRSWSSFTLLRAMYIIPGEFSEGPRTTHAFLRVRPWLL